jgi:ribose 5-phosphate isomerase B
MKRIAFGCDHVGFILKEEILAHLHARGVDVVDKGAWSTERTDYPYFASAVAQAIVEGDVEGGILICGTGVGISITANKFPGIRAVVCSEPYSAQLSRQHNNTNVLAFGSRR